MLKQTKQFCDYLIVELRVALTLDSIEKNKPIHTEVKRYNQFRVYKLVNEIVSYTIKLYLENILRFFAVDVWIKEDTYKNKKNTGKGYCEEKGIER